MNPAPPASSNRLKILAGALAALLLVLLTAIVAGVVGYWLGTRSTSAPIETAKTNAASPAPSESPVATPTATPTPTPTPDIGGKYTGPTGDVGITKVSDKTFTFNIAVGNKDGVGHVDGQATRTSPNVGVYSQIPDETLYNDPDSMYYQKKCRITFRFSGTKLSVSEDDFACSYWHGAAVDFNGTFSLKKK